MNKYPLVSVIIPVFNTPKASLLKAISSVINQSYPNIEVCVCDDGSTNSVLKDDIMPLFLQSLLKRNFCLMRHNYNRGISQARNTAIAAANGDWLTWLDADDTLDEGCIEQLVNSSVNKTLVIGECIVDDGETIHRRIPGPYFEAAKHTLGTLADPFLQNIISIQPQLVSRQIFYKIGEFDTSYRFAELSDLFLRYVISEGLANFNYCPTAIYNYNRNVQDSHTSHRDELSFYRLKALNRYKKSNEMKNLEIYYIGRDAYSQMQRYGLKQLETKPKPKEKICHN